MSSKIFSSQEEYEVFGFLVYIIKGLPLDTVHSELTHSLRIPLTPSPWDGR